MTGSISKTQTHLPPASASAGACEPKSTHNAAARHPVVPDFVRFKMHRLGERLDHIQPLGAAYAHVLKKLKIAPEPAPAPEPIRPVLGRARSSSLPALRPTQPPGALSQ